MPRIMRNKYIKLFPTLNGYLVTYITNTPNSGVLSRDDQDVPEGGNTTSPIVPVL